MTKDVPKVFSGVVEVDETYLGGQWKNKRLNVKKRAEKQGKTSKKGGGASKTTSFWYSSQKWTNLGRVGQ